MGLTLTSGRRKQAMYPTLSVPWVHVARSLGLLALCVGCSGNMGRAGGAVRLKCYRCELGG
jgi:hypothetical protein